MKQARHHRALALALIAVAATTLAACSGDDDDDAGSSARTSTTTELQESHDGSIDPGAYRIPKSASSVADFTVTFPKGWTAQQGHVYLKHSNTDDELGFDAVVVDDIYADPCVGSNSGERTHVGPSVNDLAAALLEQPGPKKSGPVDTRIGGYPAKRIDLTVPKGYDLKACNLEGVGLQIWHSQPADKYFVLLPDGIASVYILDVGGRRQVFLTQHPSSASATDTAELQTVLDSIHVES